MIEKSCEISAHFVGIITMISIGLRMGPVELIVSKVFPSCLMYVNLVPAPSTTLLLLNFQSPFTMNEPLEFFSAKVKKSKEENVESINCNHYKCELVYQENFWYVLVVVLKFCMLLSVFAPQVNNPEANRDVYISHLRSYKSPSGILNTLQAYHQHHQ